jgi:2,4-dienoyl-CoA reductase-like NADH-dependent reductase (Old Yellow Enzyme family)
MAVPQELDSQGIKKIIDDFGQAAVRAIEAGFDVIEIHAAHGYLLHSFLSPLANERHDDYGGSLENRARLLIEIVERIRSLIPEETPLFIRFSATDWVEGGWTVEDTATVASWTQEKGADFFDISSGGLLRDIFIAVSPGYQVPLTESVRKLGHVNASAVGKITTPQQAENIIASGKADAIFLGRKFTSEPHFALRAAHELGVAIDYCPIPFQAADWTTA